MKSEQSKGSSAPIVIAIIIAFVLWVKAERATQSETSRPDGQKVGDQGKLPTSGYLGELGLQDTYKNQKKFWGDDTISQGAEGIAGQIGQGLNKLQSN